MHNKNQHIDEKLQQNLQDLMQNWESNPPEDIDIDLILNKEIQTVKSAFFKKILYSGGVVISIGIVLFYFLYNAENEEVIKKEKFNIEVNSQLERNVKAKDLNSNGEKKSLLVPNQNLETKVVSDKPQSKIKNTETEKIINEIPTLNPNVEKQGDVEKEEDDVNPFEHFINQKKAEKQKDSLDLFKK